MDAATQQATRVLELLQTLRLGGVQHVVCSPGARNAPLLRTALSLDWQVHSILDERAAAFFALGLARQCGAPTLLLCTSGSAGAHYTPAVIEASHSGIPLLIITADRPVSLHDCGARQTCNQTQFFMGQVRLQTDVGLLTPAPETAPWVASLAVRVLSAASGERPGPVHLNLRLAEPLWDEIPKTETASRALLPLQRGVLEPEPMAIQACVTRLLRAERGVIVVGHRELCSENSTHPNDNRFAERLAVLAQRLGWPLLCEPSAAVRQVAGLHIHAYDALLRQPEFAARMQPDVVLRFGAMPVSNALSAWLQHPEKQSWQCVVQPHADLIDPVHSAALLLQSDPLLFCDAVLATLDRVEAPTVASANNPWARAWRQAEQAAESTTQAHCEQGFWSGAIVQTLAATLTNDTLLHVANSMPMRDLDSFAGSLLGEVRVTGNRGVNGIDGVVATALGQQCVWGGRVVVLTGDLSLLHDLSGLHLAAQRHADLQIVLIDNSGGRIFEFLPGANHWDTAEHAAFVTSQKVHFEALCTAFGGLYRRVEDRATLQAALTENNPNAQWRLIHAVVDAADDLKRHRQYWAAVAAQERSLV